MRTSSNFTPWWGTVVDANQNSVEGAYVSVEHGTEATPEIAVETDKNGHFQLVLPEGSFRIVAIGPDGSSGVFETQESAAKQEIWIELKPLPC